MRIPLLHPKFKTKPFLIFRSVITHVKNSLPLQIDMIRAICELQASGVSGTIELLQVTRGNLLAIIIHINYSRSKEILLFLYYV